MIVAGLDRAMFAMGCFWGVERRFWQHAGVRSTQAGYAGGTRTRPNYPQVCTGETGHAEVVYLEFAPGEVSYGELLEVFWTSHDPTQGMRQGNDVGNQYRSAIYCYGPAQLREALDSRATYQAALSAAGFGAITTEVSAAPEFWPAESYHQRYLEKNPGGYCGLAGTGVPYRLRA